MIKSNDSSGHSALRRGRWSAPGQAYLITFTTHQRRPWFSNPELAISFCRTLNTLKKHKDVGLLAWVLMPDHWHGLIQLGVRDSLPDWVACCKSLTTKRLPASLPRPIWARAFHDHAVRGDEDLQQIARYIVLNPVRAGLASRCGLWPWWDAAWI